ncbi:MAG: hypothetical protein GF405_08940 [Candidatus Eisenbacteria bacterium]|nr:hypothetical protein [Candidatus Eisenbacteria bacterium]
MNRYHIAPSGWVPGDDDPFTVDGLYPAGTSCIVLREDDLRTWYGALPNGLFAFHVHAGAPTVDETVADFIRYENALGRVPIVKLPRGFTGSAFVEDALARVPAPSLPRKSDPRWLVHATTTDAWTRVLKDGELRASSELRPEARPDLGSLYLGEPPEFHEYVMLAAFDSISPEIVVASQERGELSEDPDAPYAPGVRMYFEFRGLLAAGIGVRDGRHTHKVHRRLPLDPHLMASVHASDDGPTLQPGPAGRRTTGGRSLLDLRQSDAHRTEGDHHADLSPTWTPRTFAGEANAVFLRWYGASSR